MGKSIYKQAMQVAIYRIQFFASFTNDMDHIILILHQV